MLNLGFGFKANIALALALKAKAALILALNLLAFITYLDTLIVWSIRNISVQSA